MNEEELYLNEERLGDLSIDQRVSGEKDTEYLHVSRPVGSTYKFEYAMVSVLTDTHVGLCLEDEDRGLEDFDFDEMYR